MRAFFRALLDKIPCFNHIRALNEAVNVCMSGSEFESIAMHCLNCALYYS